MNWHSTGTRQEEKTTKNPKKTRLGQRTFAQHPAWALALAKKVVLLRKMEWRRHGY